MDRLQRKCVIASAGFHLLLVLILFIGPAFLSSKSRTDDMPILDFVPVKTVDALVSGGGNPNGRLPEPPPPAPQPKPVVAPAPQPQPIVEAPKPPEPEPVLKETPEPSLEPSPRKPRKPEVSTKILVRKPNTDAEAKARADAQAREAADERRRVANLFGKAASNVENGKSSGISIDPKDFRGPGGGGVPYANFLQAVKSVYAREWVVPDGITDDEATTVASVTIARDGSVVSSRITRSSGSPAVDRSVQVTLDRVKHAAPLPDDAKENQRTVTINFNVRAKRALG